MLFNIVSQLFLLHALFMGLFIVKKLALQSNHGALTQSYLIQYHCFYPLKCYAIEKSRVVSRREQRLRLLKLDLDYLRPPRSTSGIDFMKLFNGPLELDNEDKPCAEDNLDVDFKANKKKALLFERSSYKPAGP